MFVSVSHYYTIHANHVFIKIKQCITRDKELIIKYRVIWISNCSLVACLKYLLINPHILFHPAYALSSSFVEPQFPFLVQCMASMCASCQSHSKIWVSWLPPTISVAVYMMTSCVYIFRGVCILLNCPSVSTCWTPSCPRDVLCLFFNVLSAAVIYNISSLSLKLLNM